MKSLIIEDNIKDIIEKYDLKSISRKKEKCYQRYFLFKYLRQEGFLLEEIGLLFNRGHDTVLHGLNMYQNLIDTKDKGFERIVMPFALDLNTNLKKENILKKDIKKVLLRKNCKKCFEVLEILFNSLNETNYEKIYSTYQNLINLKQTK